jgi:hypothetical protein
MLRVIGAGFGRTGTYSLKAALEALDFGPAYHMSEVFDHGEHVPIWQAVADGHTIDWEELFAGYASAVDWPASAFYRELMERYPEAKVILTVRDPERWYESGRNTIFPGEPHADDDGEAPSAEWLAWERMVHTVVWDGVFDGRVADRAHAIDVFNRHIEAVKAHVPPGRLLVFSAAEGWEPLCAFLGVPVPEGEPFPRLNDTATFLERERATLTDGRTTPGV